MDSFLQYVPIKQILNTYNICCAKYSSSSSLKGYFGEGDAEICMQICVRGPDLLIPLVIHPVSQKAHKAKVPLSTARSLRESLSKQHRSRRHKQKSNCKAMTCQNLLGNKSTALVCSSKTTIIIQLGLNHGKSETWCIILIVTAKSKYHLNRILIIIPAVWL